MTDDILPKLQKIRGDTRRATVLFAFSASLAVLLIPLAYRSGMPQGWIVIGPTIFYLALGATRLVGGLQADKQMEFEERFVRFAINRGSLLASAQAGGKLWKMSCLVQGLVRSETGVVPDTDRLTHLARSLKAAGALLIPPPIRLAIPAALLVALGWIVMVSWQPAARGSLLYLAVVPTLILMGWAERRIVLRRQALVRKVDVLCDRVAVWGNSEWERFRSHKTVRPFQHRMYYRDPVLKR